MAKFKVGDKVRIKQCCDCEKIGKVGLVSQMIKRCGTVVTIGKVLGPDGEWFLEPAYYIEEEKPIKYYWSESWLEAVNQ